MNCDRCPHMKRIVEALAPCQKCEAGKLHGQVRADASQNADLVYRFRRSEISRPLQSATSLPPDVEDAVRKVTATLFQLDPIALLLARHIANGGKYHNFKDALMSLNRQIAAYKFARCTDENAYALVHSWADRVRADHPVVGEMMYRRGEA